MSFKKEKIYTLVIEDEYDEDYIRLNKDVIDVLFKDGRIIEDCVLTDVHETFFEVRIDKKSIYTCPFDDVQEVAFIGELKQYEYEGIKNLINFIKKSSIKDAYEKLKSYDIEFGNNSKLKVGDIVKIRRWEEMEKTSWIRRSINNGERYCYFGLKGNFLERDKDLCGKRGRITHIKDYGVMKVEPLDELNEDELERWEWTNFSDCVLEKAEL